MVQPTYEVIKSGSGDILKLDYESSPYVPSIEDNPMVMMDVIDKMVANPSVQRIIFTQRRNFEYGSDQVKILREIADLYSYLVQDKRVLALEEMGIPSDSPAYLSERFEIIRDIVFNRIRTDPIAAYIELRRWSRDYNARMDATKDPMEKQSLLVFVKLLDNIEEKLENTKLIRIAKPSIAGLESGDRKIYRSIFRPTITPDFMFTQIMAAPPMKGEIEESYQIGEGYDKSDVVIYSVPDDIKRLYHITPPEFKLAEEKYELIDMAKKVLSEHQPRDEEFLDPEKMRTSFNNISKDLLKELANQTGITLTPEELDAMSQILIRHTIGFGIIEIMLQDPKIQDITINAPAGDVPIFLLHSSSDECHTNIIPSREDYESWASKFRLLSGRPFDEANPILDTELVLPNARSRVSLINKPLNPYGIGMAFRRHADRPWTLAKFIKVKYISPLAAGLMSFLIDGNRTMLVAGTRSSGKCLKGDTLVQLADGDLIKIKDLVEKKFEKNGYSECDDGYYSIINNTKILTTGKDLKVSPKEITCVWKRTAPEYLYKIKLKSGKQITTTAEHPLLTMDTDFFGYKESGTIKKGMRIATPRDIKIEPDSEFRLNKSFTQSSRGKKTKVPEKITPNLLEFLGYILGDGHITKGCVKFFNNSKVLRERYKKILKKVFGLDAKYKIDRKTKAESLETFSVNLVRYLNQTFDIKISYKADSIHLPDFILNLPDNHIVPLIQGLYDSNGYVSKDHRKIEYSSKCEQLVDQLQLILSRFGIIAFKKYKRYNGDKYYSLFINGKDCNTFAEKISLNHPSKLNRLNSFLNGSFMETTNIDSVPFGNHLVRILRKSLRIRPHEQRKLTGKDYWSYENNSFHISKNGLKKLVNFYEKRFEVLKNKDLTKLRTFSEILEKRITLTKDMQQLMELLNIPKSKGEEIINTSLKRIFSGSEFKNSRNLMRWPKLIPLITERYGRLLNPNQTSFENYINDINLSFEKISLDTNISSTTLKYHRYKSLDELNPKLTSYMEKFRLQDLKNKQTRVIILYNKVAQELSKMCKVDYDNILKDLFDLREELNIKNEEFNEISLGSVTNFFNNVHGATSSKVLYNLVKKSLNIYNDTCSNEVKELIALAKRLADSDLFWDEVLEVKKIKTKEKWVYDLTVDPTHNFVANGIVAHNTSLLGSLLLEIMRKYRILTVEDSVTGDTEILIKKSGKVERTTVGEVIDNQIEKYGCWYELSDAEVLGNEFDDIDVLSMNKEGKVEWKKVSKFIRHKVNKKIYKITTATGREIKVTGDHSLFKLDKSGQIKESKVSDFKEKDFIATNRILPWFDRGISKYNLVDYPHLWKKCYFKGDSIKEFLVKYKYEIKQCGKEHGYKKYQINIWFREDMIPGKILDDMYALGFKLENRDEIKFKVSGISKWLQSDIILDEDFLTFIGLWIADGCYDKNSVIMSVSSDEEQDLVKRIAKRFGLPVKKHSDQFSLILNSKTLKSIMHDLLQLRGNAYTKRMPYWIFQLGKKQISYVLKGMFSGDGHAGKKEIVIPLASKNLLKDIQTLLLIFGIRLRLGKKRKDKTINAGISTIDCWKLFKEHIGFLQKFKNNSLDLLCQKISTHDSSDIIPLHMEDKKIMKSHIKSFKYRDYILRDNNIGRKKLQSMTLSCQVEELSQVQALANSDVFWDKIRNIEVIEQEGNVYDFSVPETENFICENIIAHNTLELPTEHMRKLGYNIQPLKVRSALVAGGAELPASEGIRSSLRLGDSALIVGEVRSEEAIALYEAMRIGALANVVAGTIHGDSPYGVFDRVVNDLKVPPTSFKATDIVFVANPLRSADGLHKYRRVTQITEVRKGWEEDPLRERGFVDLMKYDSRTDQLEPTSDLINGESDILKSIGANVKQWVGDWDAIWENVQLRANVKKKLVDYSEQVKDPELLEAPFVVQSNDMFHRISDRVMDEVGSLDVKRIEFEWEEWLKRELRKRRM